MTPLFFQFLVGPAAIRRKGDGARGAVVVTKCRFLEMSGCKGLCLHQCKNPAQQLFNDTLGVPLNVQPNFATGECHWAWGEEPPETKEDDSWPAGCLQGCDTRQLIRSAASLS